MTPAIRTGRQGNVVLIISDNPPVNPLGQGVRAGPSAGIEEAAGDDSAEAVVIRCDGRTFFAGADNTQFGKPSVGPSLPEICNEKMLHRAGDIDVVWVNGYGWPLYTGGPMFWADTVGLKTVIAGLERHGLPVSENLRGKAMAGRRATTDRVTEGETLRRPVPKKEPTRRWVGSQV